MIYNGYFHTFERYVGNKKKDSPEETFPFCNNSNRYCKPISLIKLKESQLNLTRTSSYRTIY